MKKILALFLMIAVSCVIAGAGLAQQRSQGYNPAIVYPGDFQPNILYVKNNGAKGFRAFPGFDRLRYVTCSDALDHLNRDGKWQGHLQPDGACGTYDEPAEYAMGNRLNFNDAVAQGSD
jgi:hypothetical protein